MGEFSAGCRYFAKRNWKTNRLRQDPRFLWLIRDDANTTVGKQTRAYDRVVVAGDKMRANAAQARTVYVNERFKLNGDEMSAVSDHYPIEFVIK